MGIDHVTTSLLLLFALAAADPQAQATPVSATAAKSADARDKVICKKFLETGSLVKGYRTCKTRDEWERERANIRQNTGNANSCMTGEGRGGC